MSHYDLNYKKQLLAFDRDCANAENECPQVTYTDNKAEIRNHELSSRQVFDYWRRNDVLWEFGYCDYLSEQAMGTFTLVREGGTNVFWK